MFLAITYCHHDVCRRRRNTVLPSGLDPSGRLDVDADTRHDNEILRAWRDSAYVSILRSYVHLIRFPTLNVDDRPNASSRQVYVLRYEDSCLGRRRARPSRRRRTSLTGSTCCTIDEATSASTLDLKYRGALVQAEFIWIQ